MNGRKEKLNKKDEFQDINLPSIQFKQKKIRSRVKIFIRYLILLSIAIIIGILVSSIIMNIKYKKLADKINNKTNSGDISIDYSNLIEKVRESIVTIGDSEDALNQDKYIDGNVTGIIIESDGKILTSYSKIKNMKDIYVKLPITDSEPIKGDVVAFNDDIDMAIIQVIYKEELMPIKFAQDSEKKEGESIVLISNATGDDYIDNIIPGIITSTNRQLNVEGKNYDLIEVNTPINTINTGGIISNLNGELIGVASKKVTDDVGNNGVYYAVNFSSLEKVVNSTNEIKDILGVLEGGFISDENTTNVVGLYVSRINQNGSAYRSGLRPTDIIFEIDGQKINDISEILEMLKNKKNGDTITCKVMRDGQVEEIKIKLDSIKK
ncbi:S1C family serine protease [Clostridium nigeriense]|uniref:S1C family serine protease n=1 Tax=Clostridium nigeriense TaxID=1805470 RepID=UPI003D32F243